MRFDWDAANVGHLWDRHQLRPETVEAAMLNHPRRYAVQIVGDERRVLYVGETQGGELLLIVTTQRKRKIRVATAHPASRKQRRFFMENKR